MKRKFLQERGRVLKTTHFVVLEVFSNWSCTFIYRSLLVNTKLLLTYMYLFLLPDHPWFYCSNYYASPVYETYRKYDRTVKILSNVSCSKSVKPNNVLFLCTYLKYFRYSCSNHYYSTPTTFHIHTILYNLYSFRWKISCVWALNLFMFKLKYS